MAKSFLNYLSGIDGGRAESPNSEGKPDHDDGRATPPRTVSIIDIKEKKIEKEKPKKDNRSTFEKFIDWAKYKYAEWGNIYYCFFI